MLHPVLSLISSHLSHCHRLQLRDAVKGAPSRGALPVDFVRGRRDQQQQQLPSPAAYLAGLDAAAYPGFHMFAADILTQSMSYLCNRRGASGGGSSGGSGGEGIRLEEVPPGLHAVSNGDIHDATHWPKMGEGVRQLQALLDSDAFAAAPRPADGSRAAPSSSSSADAGGVGSNGGEGGVPWDELFRLLSDGRQLCDRGSLPDTGYAPQFEVAASGIFVEVRVGGSAGWEDACGSVDWYTRCGACSHTLPSTPLAPPAADRHTVGPVWHSQPDGACVLAGRASGASGALAGARRRRRQQQLDDGAPCIPDAAAARWRQRRR